MTTKIVGTGSCVPERKVSNDDLALVVDTSDEWIRTRTGIRERRISEGIDTSEMASEAAKRALENAGVKAEELDIIIVGTTSSDYCFPSCACQVQGKLGAVKAVAFDVSAACSGFIFSLNTVHSFIQSGIYKTGLVVGADVMSKLTDWTDRRTCVLFGDGAGAVVVKAAETGIINMGMYSNGAKGHVLQCKGRSSEDFLSGKKPELEYVKMIGQEVFKFAVKKVPESINRLLEESHTDINEIKYFILHQANLRIVESISKRIHIPLEKFPTNIDRYGNTSAGSIPLLLDEMNREGKLQPGDKLIFSGFGAGLTWGSILLEW